MKFCGLFGQYAQFLLPMMVGLSALHVYDHLKLMFLHVDLSMLLTLCKSRLTSFLCVCVVRGQEPMDKKMFHL